jgi:hypothetical protein
LAIKGKERKSESALPKNRKQLTGLFEILDVSPQLLDFAPPAAKRLNLQKQANHARIVCSLHKVLADLSEGDGVGKGGPELLLELQRSGMKGAISMASSGSENCFRFDSSNLYSNKNLRKMEAAYWHRQICLSRYEEVDLIVLRQRPKVMSFRAKLLQKHPAFQQQAIRRLDQTKQQVVKRDSWGQICEQVVFVTNLFKTKQKFSNQNSK